MNTPSKAGKAAGRAAALPAAHPSAALDELRNTLLMLDHDELFTTTLAVAEGAELQHASVIKLVREYLPDFEAFGLVRFEIRPRPAGQHGGGDTEFALLNEQQTTLLFTFMRNSDVVRALKVRLVREFFRMRQALVEHQQRLTPDWQQARREVAQEFRHVAEMLVDVRADAGKPTEAYHFINEARLIRYAMTGDGSQPLDRDHMTPRDLRVLGAVERLDMRLIARGTPYAERKTACRALALSQQHLIGH